MLTDDERKAAYHAGFGLGAIGYMHDSGLHAVERAVLLRAASEIEAWGRPIDLSERTIVNWLREQAGGEDG